MSSKIVEGNRIANRPECNWIPVDVEKPPRGIKVQGLTIGGVMIVGVFDDEMCSLPNPFIVCWQHLPKKPTNWTELLKRMGVRY